MGGEVVWRWEGGSVEMGGEVVWLGRWCGWGGCITLSSAVTQTCIFVCSWLHLLTTLGNVCESAVKFLLFQISILMENLILRHVAGAGGLGSGAERT